MMCDSSDFLSDLIPSYIQPIFNDTDLILCIKLNVFGKQKSKWVYFKLYLQNEYKDQTSYF